MCCADFQLVLQTPECMLKSSWMYAKTVAIQLSFSAKSSKLYEIAPYCSHCSRFAKNLFNIYQLTKAPFRPFLFLNISQWIAVRKNCPNRGIVRYSGNYKICRELYFQWRIFHYLSNAHFLPQSFYMFPRSQHITLERVSSLVYVFYICI